MRRLVLAAALCASAFAQDEVVIVPKKYVSPEGMQHTVSDNSINRWVGVGKEIGIATREGLESVVDVSQKFGGTNVGRFVMFMVAWHILGRQILGIFLGFPILAAGLCIWTYSMRRFFWGYRVVTKRNADKSVEYAMQKPYEFEGDGRIGAGVLHAIFLGAFLVTMFAIIF